MRKPLSPFYHRQLLDNEFDDTEIACVSRKSQCHGRSPHNTNPGGAMKTRPWHFEVFLRLKFLWAFEKEPPPPRMKPVFLHDGMRWEPVREPRTKRGASVPSETIL